MKIGIYDFKANIKILSMKNKPIKWIVHEQRMGDTVLEVEFCDGTRETYDSYDGPRLFDSTEIIDVYANEVEINKFVSTLKETAKNESNNENAGGTKNDD